jgi:hypothetical protein
VPAATFPTYSWTIQARKRLVAKPPYSVSLARSYFFFFFFKKKKHALHLQIYPKTEKAIECIDDSAEWMKGCDGERVYVKAELGYARLTKHHHHRTGVPLKHNHIYWNSEMAILQRMTDLQPCGVGEVKKRQYWGSTSITGSTIPLLKPRPKSHSAGLSVVPA